MIYALSYKADRTSRLGKGDYIKAVGNITDAAVGRGLI